MLQVLLQTLLPLSLFIIMLSIGLSVAWRDFLRAFTEFRPLLLGTSLQIIGLPLLALLIITLSGLQGAPALALMIIACCPGGATSNGITFVFGGVVTLSVALTLISSLLAPLTAPLVTQWSLHHFAALDGDYVFPLGRTVLQLLVISVLPIILGNLAQHWWPRWSRAWAPHIKRYASLLFLGVLLLMIASNYRLLGSIVTELGAVMLVMVAVAMAMGFCGARALGLGSAWRLTLAIEIGLQNAGVGLIITEVVLRDSHLSMMLVTYGILMQVPVLAFSAWYRRHAIAPAPGASTMAAD